jgi:hypothetical protein
MVLPLFQALRIQKRFLKAFRYVLGGNTRQSGADSCEV